MNAERFQRLWGRNVRPESSAWSAEDVYAYLDKQYRHPCRSYHDSGHVDQCLGWFDRYSDTVDDADAVELAIWFHDACYSPNPQGHEERSAKLFSVMAADGMDSERKQRIIDMIGYTTHTREPGSAEEALLVDIDLASFCRPWHQYLIDTAKCKAEKEQVPDLDFYQGQIRFLEGLLKRNSFYFSPPFREHHEQDARANITRILALLESRLKKSSTSSAEAPLRRPERHGSGL
ncbi:HD domain-containing protein [Marinobacterium lacunae]|uniref:HD domain-containing protein n=1 Tax=Marinobacterium lacunae TaxID=1232683 RepID=UPI00069099F8|nr:hypothetical protein [Marinobacterium lacunae]MBR9882630.1 hypothetical protein [Oceanospirillales bacterium]